MAVNDGRRARFSTNDTSSSSHRDGTDDIRPQQNVLARAASPDNGCSGPPIFNPFFTGRPRTPVTPSKQNGIDRQEIIRRIKNGESQPASPPLEKALSGDVNRKRKSSAPSTDSRAMSPELAQDNRSIGQQIERPRSALHRGDFRDREHPASSSFAQYDSTADRDYCPPLSTSPVVPWHARFPRAAFPQNDEREFSGPHAAGMPIPRPSRPRTISNASLKNSFVYKPPTSPLVQSSRPDTPDQSHHRFSRSPDKSRRHTFSPEALHRFSPSWCDAMDEDVGDPRPRPSALRSGYTFPCQAHQPRRSLQSIPFASLPHTPLSRLRAPSFSESPLHHAPMVGSYEESILRGRMSTTPSKPLNFLAQIGVLGKGNCKSSLRCPPHVSIPFPAVFYSYNSGSRANDQPSPYVGLIDLENNLPAQDTSQTKHSPKVFGDRASKRKDSQPDSHMHNIGNDAITTPLRQNQREYHKLKRSSASSRAPPGGSYRIPQQGQLQIVIKNPNKTAVKLFLVPYDLSDMEPGQKTFIRQRSYSAGPIIDMPLSSRKNLGTDRPEASLNPTDDPRDKPMLRYLIHLHICCPSKGRFFLYKSIRVVFANRVPDGKENLRNETQCPEPRYSAYRPGRESKAAGTATRVRDGPRSGITGSYHGPSKSTPPGRIALLDSLSRKSPGAETWANHGSPFKLQTQSLPGGLADAHDTISAAANSPSFRLPSSQNLEIPPASRYAETLPRTDLRNSDSASLFADADIRFIHPQQLPSPFPTFPSNAFASPPSPNLIHRAGPSPSHPFAESLSTSALSSPKQTFYSTPLLSSREQGPSSSPAPIAESLNPHTPRPRHASLLSQRLMDLAVRNTSPPSPSRMDCDDADGER